MQKAPKTEDVSKVLEKSRDSAIRQNKLVTEIESNVFPPFCLTQLLHCDLYHCI